MYYFGQECKADLSEVMWIAAVLGSSSSICTDAVQYMVIAALPPKRQLIPNNSFFTAESLASRSFSQMYFQQWLGPN